MNQQEDFDITPYSAPGGDEFSFMDVADKPRIVKIVAVTRSNDMKRGLNIVLEGFEDRPWKPGKNMQRVLHLWGTRSSQLVGHRLRLYGDPEVTYGKEKPGGVRISHMDGIDEVKTVPVRFKRGKSSAYVVRPLSELEAVAETSTGAVTLEQINAAVTVDELRALWNASLPADFQAAITNRAKELENADK